MYEELLPEQINDSQGQNYQEDTGANHCLTEVPGVVFLAVAVGLQFVEFQRQNANKFASLQEQGGIVVIGPLPGEGEEDNGNHHGNRIGKHQPEEHTKVAGAVDHAGFFNFGGQAPEELP